MINVTVKTLSDNSTQYHVTTGDINGRLIKSCHTVDFFGFDFAGGYDNWRLRADDYAAEDTRLELLASHREEHARLLKVYSAAGFDSMDIFFNYGGRFTPLKEITAWFGAYKAGVKY